jgi:anaerobic selenocysteine-containing dehydrogenase
LIEIKSIAHLSCVACAGGATSRAKVTDGTDPRVIHVQHGWWFPEQPGSEYGVWTSNANLLTNNQPPYDLAMGTYQLRALLCRVTPADAPETDTKKSSTQ